MHYAPRWEVEFTDQFECWWETLNVEQQAAIEAAVGALEDRGPGLGRPFAERIAASRFPNMKELIPMGGHLRILFAFDPRRVAILLCGGDKSGRWNEWYRRMVPFADELYEEHLVDLRVTGEI